MTHNHSSLKVAMGRENKSETLGEKLGRTQTDSYCPKCGYFITYGDWPFCNGDPDQHGR